MVQQWIIFGLAIICTIVASALSVFWFVKWLKTKSKIMIFFCVMFVFFGFWAFGNGISDFITNEYIARFVLMMVNYLGIIAMILFFPIIDLFEHENLTASKSLIFAFLLGAVTVGYVIPTLYWVEKSPVTGAWIFHTHLFIDLIRASVFIIISIYLAYVFRKMAKISPKKLKRDVYFLAMSIFIGIDGVFVIYILNLVNILPDIGLRFLVGTIGLILMCYFYWKNPSISLILTEQVYQLLVIHNSGLLIFEHEFRKGGLSLELVGSAIDGISKFLQEALGVESDLKEIRFKNRIILLEVNEYCANALVTGKSTFLLKESLKTFSEKFFKKFENDIVNFYGKTSHFKEAKKLMKTTFAYLSEFST